MRHASLRERLNYRFDNFMSRGTPALVGGLALVTTAVIVVFALFVMVTGAARGQDGPSGFGSLLWRNLMRTIDAGAVTGDSGSPVFLVAMLGVTIAGIFVLSALIGVLSTGLESKLAQLRKGRSRVLERGHTVILGWSQEIFTVVAEYVAANKNQRRSCVVILAPLDKVAMEDELAARVPEPGRTKIVVRSGSPSDADDIAITGIDDAKAVIVLSPETDEPDTDVVKTLLAVVNGPNRRPEPYHVVAELHDRANVQVAQMIGGDEVSVIDVDEVVARITAQTCRQSGLSVVYVELLDFDGDEIYVARVPELAGKTFGEALLLFEDSCLIGLVDGGGPKLNPPMDSVLGPDAIVVAISRDDDTVTTTPSPAAPEPRHVRTGSPAPQQRERTLILGWNDRGARIVRELDGYLAPGSQTTVVATAASAAGQLDALTPALSNTELTFVEADTTERAVLDGLQIPSFDHVIVLCYSQDLDAQRADARTLVTLLHLRDIAARSRTDFSVVSEMLDIRNRDLASVAKADDFIVSNRLVSLLVTQISESKHLGPVFANLLDETGSEIYLKPIADYVACDEPVSFATVVHAARERGEVAIGYRIRALAEDASAAHGVTVNPPKSSVATYSPDDRVIVLAES